MSEPQFDYMGNPIIEYVEEGALGTCTRPGCDMTALVEYHDDTRACVDHVEVTA